MSLTNLNLDQSTSQPIVPNGWHSTFSNFNNNPLVVAIGTFNPHQSMGEVLHAPSPEHAYQCQKTTDSKLRQRILDCTTAAKAKAYGRGLSLRPDWDEVKYHVMWEILNHRWYQHNLFKKMLIATKSKPILEITYWGDTLWGCTQDGRGANVLGQMLVALRDQNKENTDDL